MPISSSLRQILTTPSVAALQTFDPWNSTSTGHQVADSRSSKTTNWRQTRNNTLNTQYAGNSQAGNQPGRRGISQKPSEPQNTKNGDIRSFLGGVNKRRRVDEAGRYDYWNKTSTSKPTQKTSRPPPLFVPYAAANDLYTEDSVEVADDPSILDISETGGAICFSHTKENNRKTDLDKKRKYDDEEREALAYIQHQANRNSISYTYKHESDTSTVPIEAGVVGIQGHVEPLENKQIFANVTVYINGSTSPLISDYQLKSLLVKHGAKLSMELGRRNVTHVILGRPNTKSQDSNLQGKGVGGGLAGRKLQYEIQRTRGKPLQFVDVEW
ncbi:hypothetical protein FQN57_002789 [Myotisia sp. PD_48]|nr:hypothetical protein FQN57_002789 [Myotisia sp. PD_48]